MKLCPSCNTKNREGVFYCEECGQILIGVTASTRQIDLETGQLQSKTSWGTSHFNHTAPIVIHVSDNATPITLEAAEETTIGRYDGTSPGAPTLNMTPFGAYEKGVSRLHAALRKGEETLMLVDLGSVNGTYLNGQRLIPNQPRILRDGDEIRLGRLICHIYFK